MPVIGQVKIQAKLITNVQVGDTNTIRLILKDNQWDIVSVTSRQSSIPYVDDVTIIANMWSSLDVNQIEQWIRQDLGSRYSVGAVIVTVLKRTGKTPVTPKPVTANVPAANSPILVTSPDYSAAIKDLTDKLAALNKPKSSGLNNIASTIGVSTGALTLLAVAVGVVVLISARK